MINYHLDIYDDGKVAPIKDSDKGTLVISSRNKVDEIPITEEEFQQFNQIMSTYRISYDFKKASVILKPKEATNVNSVVNPRRS